MRLVWVAIVVLVLTACGGETADTPSTTTSTIAENTAISLSGVTFDVHQEPG